MIDDVGIGHGPILSGLSNIARADLSDATRYDFRSLIHMPPKTRTLAEKKAIGGRLKMARKRVPLTQAELSERLSLPQSVISDWENGKLDSWTDHADALGRALGLEPGALFTLVDGNEDTDAMVPAADLPRVIDRSDLPLTVQVPEYDDVRLSAGSGFVVGPETIKRYWPLPRFLIEERLGLELANLTIQEVIGDSMEPTLSSGDYVLIDHSDRRLGVGGLFAVWDGDALVVKRLERIPGEDVEMLRLKSDNPLHGEYRVLAERVNVVGRVRWITKRA